MQPIKYLLLCTLVNLIAGATLLFSQTNNLYVEHSYKRYKQSVTHYPYMKMAELRHIPLIVYDLRYATKNNFMRRLMYPANTSTAFLRQPAAEALFNVQQELNKDGLGVKVFDAYRPYSVSQKFWKLVKDERYVANPTKGSNHNRGTAIDLTLIDLKTGKELDMGTSFDNFSDTAHHSFQQLPSAVLANRNKLKAVMERNGFTALETEWWHYTFKSPMKFEVMNISFKKLDK